LEAGNSFKFNQESNATLADPAAALLYLENLPPDKLLTVEQVLSLIPLSISTWRRGVKSGRFQPGVRLSVRSVFWRVDDIRALLRTPKR
jgi:predicted DNA-binding transcriptional regulator AlpA